MIDFGLLLQLILFGHIFLGMLPVWPTINAILPPEFMVQLGTLVIQMRTV